MPSFFYVETLYPVQTNHARLQNGNLYLEFCSVFILEARACGKV